MAGRSKLVVICGRKWGELGIYAYMCTTTLSLTCEIWPFRGDISAFLVENDNFHILIPKNVLKRLILSLNES